MLKILYSVYIIFNFSVYLVKNAAQVVLFWFLVLTRDFLCNVTKTFGL